MKVTITVRQGTHLMRAAMGGAFPAKVGDRTFSDNIRSRIVSAIKALLRDLRKVSPIYAEEDKPFFGPRDAWAKREISSNEMQGIAPETPNELKTTYEEKDYSRKVEVKLTAELSRYGLSWLLFLWYHPASPIVKTAGFQLELSDSIVADLGLTKWIEAQTGVDKAEEIKVDYEPMPAADAPAEDRLE